MKKFFFCLVFLVAGCGGGGDSGTSNTPSVSIPAKQNSAPFASITNNSTAKIGTIILNGSNSSDSDSDKLSFKWAIESKPPRSLAQLSSNNVEKPEFTADKIGEYKVSLIVNDGKVDSRKAEITIKVTIPTNWIVFSFNDELTNEPIKLLDLSSVYGSFIIACRPKEVTYYVRTTEITANGFIGYRLGNDIVQYQTWRESTTSFKALYPTSFDMTLIQKLYLGTEFVFQYNVFGGGVRTMNLISSNMYAVIEETRDACNWSPDLFPIKEL